MAKRKKIEQDSEMREAFSANVRVSLIEAFNLAQAQRKIKKKQDAIEQAIEAWIKSVPVPDVEQKATTPIEQVVRNDTLARLEGTSTWVDAMLRLLESGVGVDQFRQLTAIFQSRDTEVIQAISSNLAVFARVETVRTAINERAIAAVPEDGTRSDIRERVQGFVKGSAEAHRTEGEDLGEIEARRKADSRDRRRTGES